MGGFVTVTVNGTGWPLPASQANKLIDYLPRRNNGGADALRAALEEALRADAVGRRILSDLPPSQEQALRATRAIWRQDCYGFQLPDEAANLHSALRGSG